jgi:DNA-binding NarL/FixJ family response regulator
MSHRADWATADTGRLLRGAAVSPVLLHGLPAPIDVVLMDVQMPGLYGPQTFTLLREIDPHVRCVFMSGNTGRYSAEELIALGASRVLSKPFASMAGLAQTLRLAAGHRP